MGAGVGVGLVAIVATGADWLVAKAGATGGEGNNFSNFFFYIEFIKNNSQSENGVLQDMDPKWGYI